MRIERFETLMESGEFHNTPSVISIGVFDGVHNGHRAILEKLAELKQETGALISAVLTFSTNPKSRRGALDTLRLREEYIASFGIDILVVIDFSPVFSMITACEFTMLLRRAFMPVGAVFGEDFRFGNPDSAGDGHDFGRFLKADGVNSIIEIVDSVRDEQGERISSTRLRQMIEKGELGCFPKLSGQFYGVDLVPLPYRSGSGELIFSRASIHQLLPPPGAYDASLAFQDGTSIACIAVLDGENLTITGVTEGKDDLLLDSLYLEKKR